MGIMALIVVAAVGFTGCANKVLIRNEAAEDLRGLHKAAMKYVEDAGHWPQMPEGLIEGEEKDFFDFWMNALKPYGATKEMWSHTADQPVGNVSYVPTAFDAQRYTAYRWHSPWFSARGDFGNGAVYVIMPDGSVTSAGELEKEEKAKAEAKSKKAQ